MKLFRHTSVFLLLLPLLAMLVSAAEAKGADLGNDAASPAPGTGTISITDPHIAYSPYNWYKSGAAYAQSPNPGAYLQVGFTGTRIAVNIDVSPLAGANVPVSQYPLVRYSVDAGPPTTVQLTPVTTTLPCASGLAAGSHTLLLQYVAGYVFLDFWTPVNVLRVTGFTVDSGASTLVPSGAIAARSKNALFLGDSITNGDNTVATFTDGITNAVRTQDATVGYPAAVAAAIGSDYGIVAYGGASWDGTAADGHTPGLMIFYSLLDSRHSRLVAGKFSPCRMIFSSIWAKMPVPVAAMFPACLCRSGPPAALKQIFS